MFNNNNLKTIKTIINFLESIYENINIINKYSCTPKWYKELYSYFETKEKNNKLLFKILNKILKILLYILKKYIWYVFFRIILESFYEKINKRLPYILEKIFQDLEILWESLDGFLRSPIETMIFFFKILLAVLEDYINYIKYLYQIVSFVLHELSLIIPFVLYHLYSWLYSIIFPEKMTDEELIELIRDVQRRQYKKKLDEFTHNLRRNPWEMNQVIESLENMLIEQNSNSYIKYPIQIQKNENVSTKNLETSSKILNTTEKSSKALTTIIKYSKALVEIVKYSKALVPVKDYSKALNPVVKYSKDIVMNKNYSRNLNSIKKYSKALVPVKNYSKALVKVN